MHSALPEVLNGNKYFAVLVCKNRSRSKGDEANGLGIQESISGGCETQGPQTWCGDYCTKNVVRQK
jgi:hypothetical protein